MSAQPSENVIGKLRRALDKRVDDDTHVLDGPVGSETFEQVAQRGLLEGTGKRIVIPNAICCTDCNGEVRLHVGLFTTESGG